MLRITGKAVQRKNYVRVPMADALGPVAAFIYPTYTEYRPKNGSDRNRLMRARMIAAELGGTTSEEGGLRGYRAYVDHTH